MATKHSHAHDADTAGRESTPQDDEKALYLVQVELVKLQREIIAGNGRILVILEGRDAAGKDGAIKRIVEHLSPRDTRAIALGKPSDRDESSWYIRRYVRYLPAAQEMVLFNRSWYNRAGVEPVMGFCTAAECQEFLRSVPEFEQLLVRSGIKLIKYYLDVSKAEQRRRLKARAADPLTQWKLSPVDDAAQKKWKQYSRARNEMLARTHTPDAPWTIVRADDKHQARLNLIRDLLSRLYYKGKNKALLKADRKILFPYSKSWLTDGRIAP